MPTTHFTPSSPINEIQSALDAAQPGDRIVLAPGIYRGGLTLTSSGTAEQPVVLEAERMGETILTGADVVTDWTPDPQTKGAFTTTLDLSDIPPDPKYGLLAGRCEQVFIDGVSLQQVLHADQLRPGTFLYDETQKKLIIYPAAFTGEFRDGEVRVDAGKLVGGGEVTIDRASPENCWSFLLQPFDPANHCIEVTTCGEVFRTEGAHLEVRGLVFRASGVLPQQCMVRFKGTHVLVEDCVFEYSASRGFDWRTDHGTMRRCTARLNGQMGFSGYGRHNLIEDTILSYNNTKHSSFTCFEQGGCKIVRSDDFVLRRVRCVGNDGPGLWYDIDNVNAVIEQCWCEGNSGPGIMYEISSQADIRNNVCVRNGYAYQKDVRFDSIANSVGHEEPVYGQGILVQMSREVRVYNNTCVGNRRCGIEVKHHPYQQAGNAGHSTETYVVRDNEVFNNMLVDNAWDNLIITPQPANPVKKEEVGVNTHDYNLFHSSAALRQFGGNLADYARWGKVQGGGSMSLEEWRANRHQDLHSIQWEPFFVAPGEMDFRIETCSPSAGRGRPEPACERDYLGRIRPEHPAIGAFEPG